MPSFSLGDAIRNAKPRSFDPIPAGTYVSKVAAASFKFASTGNPMFVVRFQITEGEYENRALFRNIVFTEKSVDIAVEQLAALGFEDQQVLAEALDGSGDPDDVCRAILDVPAILTVTEREWQGKVQNDVKSIRPLQQAAGSPASRPAGAPARPF